MDIEHQFKDTRKLVWQRNAIAGGLAASLLLNTGLMLYNSVRDTEVILQPVLQSPLTISSGVSRDYLELITRDTAYAILNRTPQSLGYWMNSVLKITDPASYGTVKAQMLRAVGQLRGSDITQTIDISMIDVHEKDLRSAVTGVLHVFVGQKEVSQTPVHYYFEWSYHGLSLKLKGFGTVADPNKPGVVAPVDPYIEQGGQ